MKFRPSAAIAIYFLFILLWVNLHTHASDTEENKKMIPVLQAIISQGQQHNVQFHTSRIDHLNEIKKQILSLQQKLHENTKINPVTISQQNFTNRLDFLKKIKKHTLSLQQKLPPYRILTEINNDIFSLIFDQFLTIQDILILRQTSTEMSTFLQPNKQNMIMYCTNFRTKQMAEVPLMWFDLKCFLDQSYKNVRENETQIISWYNQQTPYTKVLFNKSFSNKQKFDTIQYEPPKIYNKRNDAWAQITKEGNVVTGGNQEYGGDSTHAQFQLQNVKIIVASLFAFAALLNDGCVVAWGLKYPFAGGTIPEEIQTQLQNVKIIRSATYAFAALMNNGSVLAWGSEHHGGKIPDDIQLQNVKMIFSTYDAFAAVLEDGHVVAWGDEKYGGKIPDEIQTQLENVKMIFSTNGAFAALLNDGSAFTWGDENYGGKIPDQHQAKLIKNVKQIVASEGAFTALLKNGHIVAWGNENFGGFIPDPIRTQLENVKTIVANDCAFAALLDDDSVVTWGAPRHGGKITNEIGAKLMKNIKLIFPEKQGFTALCKTGELINWGEF